MIVTASQGSTQKPLHQLSENDLAHSLIISAVKTKILALKGI
jgi:hypothetical protein